MNPRWLFRMAVWAHRPPGTKRVLFVLGIVVACLLLFLIDRYVGLPDWMSMEPIRRNRLPLE